MSTDKPFELYGFSGKLGSGKNYIAEHLFLSMLPEKKTLVMALADQLKVSAIMQEGLDYHKVFHEKDKETRIHLQRVGTDEGRLKYGEGVWAKNLETWIKVYRERGLERVIVTDVRFPNEVKWIKSQGGTTFRINAPQRNMDQLKKEANGDPEQLEVIRNHLSEVSLDNYEDFDYIIDNDYEHQRLVGNQVRNIIRELMAQKPTKLTIFCDMDDTICMCSRFYTGIVKQVCEMIQADTKISETQIQPLLQKHIFSYETRYFTLDDFSNSLVNLTVECYLVTNRSIMITSEKLKEVYDLGMTVFDQIYDPLYEDSLQRVKQLQEYGQVVLYTLGDHTEQMKKIAHLNLLYLPIEIFHHKDENMFRHLMNKYKSDHYVMIGDSYKRDIIPAQKAGIENLVWVTRNQESRMKDGIYEIERLNDDLMEHLQSIK